jgi:hypothetical protein
VTPGCRFGPLIRRGRRGSSSRFRLAHAPSASWRKLASEVTCKDLTVAVPRVPGCDRGIPRGAEGTSSPPRGDDGAVLVGGEPREDDSARYLHTIPRRGPMVEESAESGRPVSFPPAFPPALPRLLRRVPPDRGPRVPSRSFRFLWRFLPPEQRSWRTPGARVKRISANSYPRARARRTTEAPKNEKSLLDDTGRKVPHAREPSKYC